MKSDRHFPVIFEAGVPVYPNLQRRQRKSWAIIRYGHKTVRLPYVYPTSLILLYNHRNHSSVSWIIQLVNLVIQMHDHDCDWPKLARWRSCGLLVTHSATYRCSLSLVRLASLDHFASSAGDDANNGSLLLVPLGIVDEPVCNIKYNEEGRKEYPWDNVHHHGFVCADFLPPRLVSQFLGRPHHGAPGKVNEGKVG